LTLQQPNSQFNNQFNIINDNIMIMEQALLEIREQQKLTWNKFSPGLKTFPKKKLAAK
jgi:hypothetical protein